MAHLTKHQDDAMQTFSNYVGQTVEVLTSQYAANVNPDFVRRQVGIMNSAALRGLQSKGYIKIEDTFWKGARVTVLRGLD